MCPLCITCTNGINIRRHVLSPTRMTLVTARLNHGKFWNISLRRGKKLIETFDMVNLYERETNPFTGGLTQTPFMQTAIVQGHISSLYLISSHCFSSSFVHVIPYRYHIAPP
jgi:hypothetical protein